jgi:hypothetical protein
MPKKRDRETSVQGMEGSLERWVLIWVEAWQESLLWSGEEGTISHLEKFV